METDSLERDVQVGGICNDNLLSRSPNWIVSPLNKHANWPLAVSGECWKLRFSQQLISTQSRTRKHIQQYCFCIFIFMFFKKRKLVRILKCHTDWPSVSHSLAWFLSCIYWVFSTPPIFNGRISHARSTCSSNHHHPLPPNLICMLRSVPRKQT